MPPSAPRAHNTRPIARYVGAAVPELAPGASYETTSDREVTLFEDFHLLSSPGPSSIPHGQCVHDGGGLNNQGSNLFLTAFNKY